MIASLRIFAAIAFCALVLFSIEAGISNRRLYAALDSCRTVTYLPEVDINKPPFSNSTPPREADQFHEGRQACVLLPNGDFGVMAFRNDSFSGAPRIVFKFNKRGRWR